MSESNDQPGDANEGQSESATEANTERRILKIGSQRETLKPAATTEEVPSPAIVDSPLPVETAEPVDPTFPSVSTPQEWASVPPLAAPPAPPPPTPAAKTVVADAPAIPAKPLPPPRIERISPELQREIDEALGGASLEQLLMATPRQTNEEPQIDERYRATITKVHRDDVFLTLPGQYDAVASSRQFADPPEPGNMVEVIVVRYSADDGIYEVRVPGATTAVGNWDDIEEGMVIEAMVTGHNTGGLECEINSIRGFIPAGQVALYRVENLEEFQGKKLACVVTECNPQRGNLVLSHKGVLEREAAENKQQLMKSLEVGSLHEGIVRKIMNFGAFVDIGGVDGLVHVSKLSWDRVAHPSDVLEEGQKIKVRVDSIDQTTGKIGLSYRDTMDHPWKKAAEKYAVNAIVSGTVSKIMDFGAFVRLEAGIEGLVHVSELAHHRVSRVESVVKEGQTVDVKILSIDPDAQKMSLSIKGTMTGPPLKESTGAEDDGDTPLPEPLIKKQHKGPLKGGTERRSGGESFGLKW